MEKILDQNGITTRVLELIDERNVTNRKFAIITNIDVSNFKKKINGELPWTINDVEKICSRESVSKEWLVSGEGEKRVECADSNLSDMIKDEIIALARKMSQNEEIIINAKSENEKILHKLNTLYEQLDKY